MEKRLEKQYKRRVAEAVVDIAVRCGARGIVLENLFWAKKAYPGTFWRWIPTSWQAYIQLEAEKKGLEVVFISPAYTSKKCPVCGRKLRRRRNRKMYCPRCNIELNRDIVAALNLYRRHTGKKLTIEDIARLRQIYRRTT